MEGEVSEVDRKLFLRSKYLDKIVYYINRNPISQDELYIFVRKFFGEYLKLDYEFTYEELSMELNKVFIKPTVKEHIDNFLIRLSESEYLEETHMGTNEINNFLMELDDIIRNMIFNDTPIEEEGLLQRVLKIKPKHADTINLISSISSGIEEINFSITNGKIDLAKNSYADLLKKYDTLDKESKKKLLAEINELYARLEYVIKNPKNIPVQTGIKAVAKDNAPAGDVKIEPLKKVNSLIDETSFYLSSSNIASAKSAYTETMTAYNSLNPDDKKFVYPKVTALYENLKSASKSTTSSIKYYPNSTLKPYVKSTPVKIEEKKVTSLDSASSMQPSVMPMETKKVIDTKPITELNDMKVISNNDTNEILMELPDMTPIVATNADSTELVLDVQPEILSNKSKSNNELFTTDIPSNDKIGINKTASQTLDLNKVASEDIFSPTIEGSKRSDNVLFIIPNDLKIAKSEPTINTSNVVSSVSPVSYAKSSPVIVPVVSPVSSPKIVPVVSKPIPVVAPVVTKSSPVIVPAVSPVSSPKIVPVVSPVVSKSSPIVASVSPVSSPNISPVVSKPIPVVAPVVSKPISVVAPVVSKPIPVVAPVVSKPIPVVVPVVSKPISVVSPVVSKPISVVSPVVSKPISVVAPVVSKPISVVAPVVSKPISVVAPVVSKSSPIVASVSPVSSPKIVPVVSPVSSPKIVPVVAPVVSKPIPVVAPVVSPVVSSMSNTVNVAPLKKLIQRIKDDLIVENMDNARKDYSDALVIYKNLTNEEKKLCYKEFDSIFVKLEEAVHKKSLEKVSDKKLQEVKKSSKVSVTANDTSNELNIHDTVISKNAMPKSSDVSISSPISTSNISPLSPYVQIAVNSASISISKLGQQLQRIKDDLMIGNLEMAKNDYTTALVMYKQLTNDEKKLCYKEFDSVFKELEGAEHRQSLSSILDKHLSETNKSSDTIRKEDVNNALINEAIDSIANKDRLRNNNSFESNAIFQNNNKLLPVVNNNDADLKRVYELIEEAYFNINNHNSDIAMLRYFKAIESYRKLSISDKKIVYHDLFSLFKELSLVKVVTIKAT